MSEKMSRLPRTESFQEHSAEFGNIIPHPVNKDIVSIQFMTTRAIPVIKSVNDKNQGSVQVEVAMETELQHSCSVNMHKSQLEGLIQNIEEFLENHKA
ncbi:hypothetical protein C0560_08980 [Lelliottia sp. AC1]|jgi:hypothetical protein|uniref:hypothetical protein n=1 Tax=Lelliottia sp. AC1 TaxID=2067959 RepID=UPI00200DBAFF|nr:hypothetical protein [Lelliottia sp. AC1]UQC70919.1 hypothetical protein C0560_08980 [Lelliottia sp. AC1]